MITAAFSGVDQYDPTVGSVAVKGRTSPRLHLDVSHTVLLFSEGLSLEKASSTMHGEQARHERGSIGQVVNPSRSEVRIALRARASSGTTPQLNWTAQPSSLEPVSATVALQAARHSVTPGEAGEICGDASVLAGPSRAPRHAITIRAGQNTGSYDTPDKTYYFAAGTHTLGTGEYAQIDPGHGDTYTGAPGAVIDGQGKNNYAFAGTATDVTIEHLTIDDFHPPGAEGAVNQSSGDDWTIEDDTVTDNSPGSGLMAGTNEVVRDDCMTYNGEYALDAYDGDYEGTSAISAVTGGPSNLTLEDNEIAYNDTCNWEDSSPDPVPASEIQSNCAGAGEYDGCGCAGGVKFWQVDGALVTGNYVYDNYDAGIWVDTDNTGFDISDNYLADNYAVALQYEISYNATITYNTFVDNAWGAGVGNPGFPTPAIYISNSGGYSQVPGYSSGSITISDNTFTNNWSGVVLFDNSDRYCSDGYDTGGCTLSGPSQVTLSNCAANLPSAVAGEDTGSPSLDWFWDCRWRTQDVTVSDNTFDFSPSAIGSDCTEASSCGQNGVFAEYGIAAPYTGFTVSNNVAFDQDNVFKDNTYKGPWTFMAWNQDNVVTWAQWTAPVTDSCLSAEEQQSGECTSGFGQDAGSHTS